MAYDEGKAARVTHFIECLKHTKGEFHGKPFHLLPWQKKIIQDVFGTVREEDPSMRQFTTAYIEIPKKQGKSELGAAIALNMLVNDDEWKAEVYSCASDRQQAAIVFDVAVDMVKQSPALLKRIKIIPSMKRMVYQPTGSIYQVLSSEVATKHGLNVSACIFDELHTQPTRALYDVMTQGSGDARKQPLWFLLTTAGTDRNSICWEVHQKALDILEGRKADQRFYPVIFGLPDDADWTSEENWYKANPSIGHTITIDKVRDAFHKAQETPADENMFRQLRLNQWVKQSIRWMPMPAPPALWAASLLKIFVVPSPLSKTRNPAARPKEADTAVSFPRPSTGTAIFMFLPPPALCPAALPLSTRLGGGCRRRACMLHCPSCRHTAGMRPR